MGPRFFSLYDRWSTEILGKCIGAFTMLARLCCKVCFSLFSIWVTVRVPIAKKGCVKNHSRKESSRSALGMFADEQCMAGAEAESLLLFRGVSVWHIHWEVWTKCKGAYFLSLSHSKLFTMCICQPGRNPAHSINDMINLAVCKFHVRTRRERF